MRRISFSNVLVFALSTFLFMPVLADTTSALVTSVNGKVQIKSSSGKTTKTAKKNANVVEGEHVVTDKDGTATLQMFDGSELKVSPNTDFQLAKLQKPSVKDKILGFKLFIGKLLAKVKTLSSAKSSFEIEAGGVVCGVRGTQFSYSFDPDANKVTVHVDEGTVYLNSKGHNYLFNAGQTGIFLDGKPNKPENPAPDQEAKGGEKGGKTPGITLGLADLNQQFKGGILINPQGSSVGGNLIGDNGNNTLTDPGVAGAVKVTIRANITGTEAVP